MPINADAAVIVRRVRSEAKPEAPQRPQAPAPVMRQAATFSRREDALARLRQLFTADVAQAAGDDRSAPTTPTH